MIFIYNFIHLIQIPLESNARNWNVFLDDSLKPDHNSTTNGVTDIMTRLEQAIASGNHKEAALLAKEVSKLQISTKLSQKESSKDDPKQTIKAKPEKIK